VFQPEVKLAFVLRYCPPADGWRVFVDLDASELGRTGGPRVGDEARSRQLAMQQRGDRARGAMEAAGVTVGGSRRAWRLSCGAPTVPGDRDIVAYHASGRRVLIAEVEGASSGQPEPKLYKAIGQIVTAVDACDWHGATPSYVLAIHGHKMIPHVRRASVLQRLGISAVHIGETLESDEWIFGGDEFRG
jgi:hypothetical protein